MFSVIKKYNGKINTVIGNSIFSYWDCINHATVALRCGLESLQVSGQFSEKWMQKGFPELTTIFGINTGLVHIGNYGSPERMSFTLFGDHINFTQRLQSANKTFGTRVLISEFTKNLVEKDFNIKHVREIRIKGKKNPANLYTVK